MNRKGEIEMKKIIPFKKDIIFKTNVSEITSISLEHTLHLAESNSIGGDFTVSGEYKITDTSVNVEAFSYNLPFDISMDERYLLEKANIDINDFYYEIINDNVLSVNIEVVIDGLEEKLVPEVVEEVIEEPVREEKVIEEIEPIPVDSLDREIESESEETIQTFQEEPKEVERCIEPEEKIGSLFDHMDDTVETYQSYKVYIVRDGDTLETILEKYSVTKEEIESYNDLKEIHLGDKIIIPTVHA